MFTQETSGRMRSRLAAALVALGLTAAVLVIVNQASSIGSTGIGQQVPRASAPSAAAIAALQTSIYIPKGCTRRKFGCRQVTTPSANPDLQTSIHISKGCWRHKFATFSRSALGGCGQDPTTPANRP